MVSLLVTEMSKMNFSLNVVRTIWKLSYGHQELKSSGADFFFQFLALQSQFLCFWGSERFLRGKHGCFCLDITCERPEIIARWSLMSLHGVPGDFGGKGGILGHFGEFLGEKKVIFRKPHFKPCRPPVPLLKSMLDVPC